MKIFNKFLLVLFIGYTSVVWLQSCKENNLVLPEQIAIEEEVGDSERAPVKQGHFTVVTNEDELARFNLENVDTERVVSLFFSHNQEGEVIDTEITDFKTEYVIKNLPLNTVVGVQVWAKDKDGLASKKAIYNVKARPYPASTVAETFSVTAGILSAIIDVSNLTSADATLFYKVDDASTYNEVQVPRPTTNMKIPLEIRTVGQRTLSYYFVDATGGKSTERKININVLAPELLNFNTGPLRAGWTPYASNSNSTAEGPPSFMLDGQAGTIWHTQWSTTTTSSHTQVQKYPFTLIFTFTETRANSASGLFNEDALKAPAGPYKPIAIKEVTLLHRGVNNYRVKDIELYGIELNGNEVSLGSHTLSNAQQENIINLKNNSKLFKAIKIVCLTTFSATDRFANLNEIYIKGYNVAY